MPGMVYGGFPMGGPASLGKYDEPDSSWIRARVIVRELFDNDDDSDFPEYFIQVPRVGDRIRTPQGRTLDVLDIVHTKTQDNKPEIQIEVGASRTQVTPTEGGTQETA